MFIIFNHDCTANCEELHDSFLFLCRFGSFFRHDLYAHAISDSENWLGSRCVSRLHRNYLGSCSLLSRFLNRRFQRTICETLFWREHLLVGDVATQNRLNAHPKDLDEHQCHKITQQEREHQWRNQSIHLRRGKIVRKDQIQDEGCHQGDEELHRGAEHRKAVNKNTYLAKQQNEISDDVHSHHAQDIANNEEECFPRRFAEGIAVDRRLYVRVLIDEPHYFLETPETTLERAQHILRDFVPRLLGFALDVGNYCADG